MQYYNKKALQTIFQGFMADFHTS